VNPAALEIYLRSHKVDTQKHQTEIAGLTSSRFVMEQEIAAAINALLGKEQIKPEQLNALIQHSGDLRLKGFEKMGDVSYTLLSFGSLIFIVAGMFLREITKLKFGAVELEKASMDQVAVTPTLNITL